MLKKAEDSVIIELSKMFKRSQILLKKEKTMKNFMQELKNPNPKARGLTRWWWYGVSVEKEEIIDLMNKELGRYISKILMHDKTGNDIEAIEEYFRIIGNVERIGDHAVNIGGYVYVMEKNDVSFSEGAIAELRKMQEVCANAMGLLTEMGDEPTEWLSKIAALEQQMDDMTVKYRNNHIDRMKSGLCSELGCILFSELLTDFERMGDHILNIAQSYTKIASV